MEADDVLSAEPPAFARAVRAVIDGDVQTLRDELAADPALIQARSAADHHATLLHYVAANGVEDELQRVPANAPTVARVLLEAGAEVDARSDAYDGRWDTPLALLVSSIHPARAGVAVELTALLCDAGAAVDGVDADCLPLASALLFGRIECLRVLIGHGARTDNPVFAAAAGDTAWLRRWLDRDPSLVQGECAAFPLARDRDVQAEQALVFGALCGQLEVVRLLLDAGVDVDAVPPGSHWTCTALHSAAGQGQVDVVELLLARGADETIEDQRYRSTPLGWAEHTGEQATAALLRR